MLSAPTSPDSPSTAEAADRAWLDVRNRGLFTGGNVPVELPVRDGALVLGVTTLDLRGASGTPVADAA